MRIVLTDDQRQALQSERGQPVDVLDPITSERYVLLARKEYDRVRPLLEAETPTETDLPIPLGILKSQQAYWRDLSELLRNHRNHGKWVCYHGDERIGISEKSDLLIRETLKRGIPDDAYYLAVIRVR